MIALNVCRVAQLAPFDLPFAHFGFVVAVERGYIKINGKPQAE